MAYELNDIEYPSVTTILGLLDKSGALTWWASGCAVEYIRERITEIQSPESPHSIEQILKDAKGAFTKTSEKALDVGTQVHDAIEQYIKTGRDLSGDLPEQVQNGFLAFLEWESKNHVQWLKSELTLYSPQYGYAGTCDAIAIINDYKYLIDFKTSKAIYDEYRMQLAAYKQGALETLGESLENFAILRLDKETGEPEFKDVTKGIDEKLRAFLRLVDFYYCEKKRRLKNNPFVDRYYGKSA